MVKVNMNMLPEDQRRFQLQAYRGDLSYGKWAVAMMDAMERLDDEAALVQVARNWASTVEVVSEEALHAIVKALVAHVKQ